MANYKQMYTDMLLAAERAIEILESAIIKSETTYLESIEKSPISILQDQVTKLNSIDKKK